MKGRDLRRVQADLAARRPASAEQAAERAHRGRDLVEAALHAARTGQPGPNLTAPPPPPPSARPPRIEVVSCTRCYAPHEGLPDTLCPRCAASTPQRLDDLVDRPPDPD